MCTQCKRELAANWFYVSRHRGAFIRTSQCRLGLHGYAGLSRHGTARLIHRPDSNLDALLPALSCAACQPHLHLRVRTAHQQMWFTC